MRVSSRRREISVGCDDENFSSPKECCFSSAEGSRNVYWKRRQPSTCAGFLTMFEMTETAASQFKIRLSFSKTELLTLNKVLLARGGPIYNYGNKLCNQENPQPEVSQ